jgi:hypothetical protein
MTPASEVISKLLRDIVLPPAIPGAIGVAHEQPVHTVRTPA